MTAIHVAGIVPPSGAPAAADVATVRFLGPAEKFWKLLIRGAVLLMATLGIYRFWFATDIRRYLWANTEIAGDALEYLGTGRELLLGFLVALTILGPLYAAFFFGAFVPGFIGQISGVVAFVLLAVLGQFAVYRARRYRLTRTMFRGLRFHQTGSGWRYAVCALFWWSMSAVTLGLAYPWGQASLERYKMRNTFYGDLQGRFEGSGTRLFAHGVLLWAVVVVPLLVGLISVDWLAAVEAIRSGSDVGTIEGSYPAFATVLLYPMVGVIWSVVAAMLLYPAFQAVMLKWWLSGLRFGAITITTRLRKLGVYGVYVRFLWHSLAFALVAVIVLGIGAVVVRGLSLALEDSQALEIATTVAVVLLYVVMALGYSTIYQATVKLGLWRLGFESVDLSGVQALERVKAVRQSTSALGEGLVDALNVGGY